ncbi:hypothetical protein ACWENQ_09915 [Nonomuraea sp. NPDC004354]
MSIETLMRGADAYTSLSEVAKASDGGDYIDIIITSLCTLTLDGGC